MPNFPNGPSHDKAVGLALRQIRDHASSQRKRTSGVCVFETILVAVMLAAVLGMAGLLFYCALS